MSKVTYYSYKTDLGEREICIPEYNFKDNTNDVLRSGTTNIALGYSEHTAQDIYIGKHKYGKLSFSYDSSKEYVQLVDSIKNKILLTRWNPNSSMNIFKQDATIEESVIYLFTMIDSDGTRRIGFDDYFCCGNSYDFTKEPIYSAFQITPNTPFSSTGDIPYNSSKRIVKYVTLKANSVICTPLTDDLNDNKLNQEPVHTEDTSDLNNIGGDGDDTNNSDAIDYPDDTATLNSNNAVNAGFITLYNPTKNQLQNLASYLWTSDFVDNIKKLFGNPMDVIIGLNQVPVTVSSSTSQSVKAGFIDTGVTMNVCDAQYIEKDLGYFTQKLYWGSCLDFDPNTKVQIYLPFIGVRPLNVNDVMGTTLHLKYRIDILTGQCVAWLKCGTSVKYEWAGHCANTIPLTASNWSQIFQSAVGLAATVGTGIAVGVATGGASVPETLGLASSSLSQASNMKPTIERSGSMGGSASIMGMKKAFLIIQRPSTSLPKDYGKLYGYASNKTRKLSSLTGFTQVEHVNLSTSYATEEEYLEIVSMLKEGVIL